jgi:glycosyltransferase involved in cell wall biosynthesis
MITVCLLSKNSAETIRRALDSVRDFPEILLLDNGSTDSTIEIAKSYSNIRVIEAPFIGFGPLRNQVAGLATNDWILMLDTDEQLSESLCLEIRALQLSKEEIYSINRHNFYNGKHITGCGWSPDRVVRLYNRKITEYSDSQVHESVNKKQLQVIKLKNPILHVPFRFTNEFIAKMQNYSSLYALQHHNTRRSSVFKALYRSLYAFIRSYFLQKGFLLGKEGLIISLYNSNSVFYKYIKLWEKNKIDLLK